MPLYFIDCDDFVKKTALEFAEKLGLDKTDVEVYVTTNPEAAQKLSRRDVSSCHYAATFPLGEKKYVVLIREVRAEFVEHELAHVYALGVLHFYTYSEIHVIPSLPRLGTLSEDLWSRVVEIVRTICEHTESTLRQVFSGILDEYVAECIRFTVGSKPWTESVDDKLRVLAESKIAEINHVLANIRRLVPVLSEHLKRAVSVMRAALDLIEDYAHGKLVRRVELSPEGLHRAVARLVEDFKSYVRKYEPNLDFLKTRTVLFKIWQKYNISTVFISAAV